MINTLALKHRRVAWLWAGAVMALHSLAGGAAPLTTLDERMQLFRNGALHGFALAELPESGLEPYTDRDLQDLAATGANVVRVSVQLRKCSGCTSYAAPEADLRYARRILILGERYGFRVIVVLLPTPWGSQSDYWDSTSLKADIVTKWGRVAQQLKGFAALQAYDLINEPVVPGVVLASSAQLHWQKLAEAITRELRTTDPDTPVMIEPTPWGLPGSFRGMTPIDTAGIVYSFHLYAPHEFTHQGLPGYAETLAYPGNGWDKLRLSQAMDEARRFSADHKVPMFVGEFSCVRWAPGDSCTRYLADAISLLDAERWGWIYHCWRCFQGWDSEIPREVTRDQRSGYLPEYRRPDSPSLILLKQSMASNRREMRN